MGNVWGNCSTSPDVDSLWFCLVCCRISNIRITQVSLATHESDTLTSTLVYACVRLLIDPIYQTKVLRKASKASRLHAFRVFTFNLYWFVQTLNSQYILLVSRLNDLAEDFSDTLNWQLSRWSHVTCLSILSNLRMTLEKLNLNAVCKGMTWFALMTKSWWQTSSRMLDSWSRQMGTPFLTLT